MVYRIIIVVLLIVFLFTGIIFNKTISDIRYKIDVGINIIYEQDLANDIILNTDTINILKNIDKY